MTSGLLTEGKSTKLGVKSSRVRDLARAELH